MPAGLQIGRQRFEPAVAGATLGGAHQTRIEVRSVLGSPLDNSVDVLGPDPLHVRAYTRGHHVAVVDLAEEVLELAGDLRALARGRAETRRRDLEQVAQALGGDAHVVL